MSQRAILLLLILTGCVATQPSASPAARPAIFREVRFDPYQPITLGEPLPPTAPPGVRRGEFLVLADLSFGGADSIYVELRNDRRVIGLHFVYPDTTDYLAQVASYSENFGAPRRVVADSAGGDIERAVWQDPTTVFLLSRFTGADGNERISSALLDRGLNIDRT